jgi:hypothetical protein
MLLAQAGMLPDWHPRNLPVHANAKPAASGKRQRPEAYLLK